MLVGSVGHSRFSYDAQCGVQGQKCGGAGIGAALGSLFGAAGGAISTIAAGLKFQEAQTTLMVSDTRSGLQVHLPPDCQKKTGVLVVSCGWGGAYTSTDEAR